MGSLSFAWIKVPCISEFISRVLPHFKPTQMLRENRSKFWIDQKFKNCTAKKNPEK
jgi:hypothetical protein